MEKIIIPQVVDAKIADRAVYLLTTSEQRRSSMVSSGSDTPTIVSEKRKTWLINADRKIDDFFRKKLLDQMSHVKDFFCHDFDLQIQSDQFLMYAPGDFISKHQDIIKNLDPDHYMSRRKFTVIIALNNQNEYDGGDFLLYDCDKYTSIRLNQGDMLVFRSEAEHEVKEVTLGRRFSFIAWLENTI